MNERKRERDSLTLSRVCELWARENAKFGYKFGVRVGLCVCVCVGVCICLCACGCVCEPTFTGEDHELRQGKERERVGVGLKRERKCVRACVCVSSAIVAIVR